MEEGGKKKGLKKCCLVLVVLSLEMMSVGARRMLLLVTPLAQEQHRRAFLDFPLSGRAEDDSVYEAKLISPLVKKRVRHRKSGSGSFKPART